MYNYDIVIIDSGLNLRCENDTLGVCIEKGKKGFEINDNVKDEIGHGTIIYSVIAKQAPTSKIFIVKLAKSTSEIDSSCLIAALKYVKENINCKIINISLGIKCSEDLGELHDICCEISKSGTIIVSAFDNHGCHSYPAAFECVIGVDNKVNFKNISEFDFIENSPINILAKGSIQRLQIDGRTLLVEGASISCAHITSLLANAMQNGLKKEDALIYLKTNARCVHSMKNPDDAKKGFFEIKNAVVFPFAKEAHAFIRFSDMLPFKIKGFYDVRYSGKVGRKLSSYYENIEPKECIMDIDHIDFKGVDTIILGHLDELNAVSNRDYKLDLIKKAIEMRVNVYSFDPLDQYSELLEFSSINYFYPKITSKNVPYNSFGKLYKIAKPVVGIFGTSSQQGKFSLELLLKRELELNDYSVGTVGTEPHSLLFGFDVVFPMGYNSTVYLCNNEIVLYLNYVINNLCLKGREIILAASQAQTIPYYCNNLLEFPSMQYHFALGIKPDAVVMCVNFHDEVAYIENSMRTLVGLTDATIIGLVMYPLTYYNDSVGIYSNSKKQITYEEFKQKAYILEEKLKVPVFMLGEQNDMKNLCREIIDFF